MKRSKRPGFSLLEILVVCSLLAFIMAATALGYRKSVTSFTHEGALTLVRSELQAARERARAEQKFVAFVISTGGTSSPDYGIETGVAEPGLERTLSLDKEFPGTWLQVGAQAATPPSDVRVPAAWFAPARNAVIFTPSGAVLSNLEVGADGRYHIQLGSDAQAKWDLAVETSGGLSATPATAGISRGSLAATTTFSTPTNHPPVLQDLQLKTSANVTRVSGVLHAELDSSQQVQLEATASDPDGKEQLFCQWTGSGAFSQPVKAPMLYDARTSLWRSSVNWRLLPAGGPSTLRCEITDRSQAAAETLTGALASTSDINKIVVQASVPEALVLPLDLIDNYTSICRMNPDGSGLRPLWRGTPRELPEDAKVCETSPQVSPDGTQVAYVATRTWPPDLVVRNVDGNNRRVLVNGWDSTGSKAFFWSAKSESIYYTRSHPTIAGTGQLVRVRADGSDKTTPTVLIDDRKTDQCYPSPDRTKLVWVVRGTTNSKLELVDLNNPTQVADVATEGSGADLKTYNGYQPVDWLADSSKIVYGAEEGGQCRIKVATPTFPPVSSNVTNVADFNYIKVGSDGSLAYTGGLSQWVRTQGTVAAPGAPSANVMSYSSGSLYSGAVASLCFSPDARFLYYMQGPHSASLIQRYELATGKVLDLGRSLRTTTAATGAGGATKVSAVSTSVVSLP